jgi:hypothetical protein
LEGGRTPFLHIRLHGLIFGYSTHPFPYATTEPKENRTVINQGLQHLSNRPTSLLVYKITKKKGIKKKNIKNKKK